MKKKFYLSALMAVCALCGAISYATSASDSTSALAMANVEALSQTEFVQLCDSYCKNRSGYVCWLETSTGFTIYCDEMVSWNYM